MEPNVDPLKSDPETLMAEIPAYARLALGSERLAIFLTNTRMIVASIGKRGAGALATTSFFGGLSGAFEDIFKVGRESAVRRRLETLNPEKILASDKDNFAVNLEDIVRVDVEETAGPVSITILTSSEKLQLSTRLGFEQVGGLFRNVLGSKVVTRRPAHGGRPAP